MLLKRRLIVALVLILVLGLLVAAVALAWKLRPADTPKTFDPQDFGRTADWLISEGLALADLYGDNAAISARVARLEKTTDALVGRRVSWLIEIERVQHKEVEGREIVWLYPRRVSRPCSPEEFQEALREASQTGTYSSRAFPYIEVRLGDRAGRGSRDYFQLPAAPWLEHLQAGDRVRVDGTVGGISFERRPLPAIASDVRIGLKEVRISPP